MPPGFQAPPGFLPPMNMGGWGNMGGMGMDGGVGPQRNRGGRFQNNRTGPYDRQGRGRGGRGGGRISPGPLSAKRFPDAAGAIAAPREATAGRSLRSYEDLDAVSGPAASSAGAGTAGSDGAGGGLDY